MIDSAVRFVLVAVAVGAALLLGASAARADDGAGGPQAAAEPAAAASEPKPTAPPAVRTERLSPKPAPSMGTPEAKPTPEPPPAPKPDVPAKPVPDPEKAPAPPAPASPDVADVPTTSAAAKPGDDAGTPPEPGDKTKPAAIAGALAAAGTETAAAPDDGTAAVQPAALEGVCPPLCLHHLTQELVDQTYDAIADTWTLTFKASLDSILPCLDHVVSCVVETAAGTSLAWVSTVCPANWSGEGEACVRRDFLPAGIDQEFLFTVVTDPGTTGTVSTTTTFSYQFLDLVTTWTETLATVTTTVDLPVRLNLTKACPDTVTAGQTLTCTLTLKYPAGTGGEPIFDLTVTDTPPPGTSGATLTFVTGPGDWHCVDALECHTHFYFQPGDVATLTFQATVDSGTDGTIVNTATAVWFYPPPFLTVTAQAEVTVVAPTDTTLSVTKAGPATVSPGGPIEWTITVANTGANAATGVVVTDVAPAGVEGATITVLSPGGATWSCVALVCTMTAGELSVNASAVFRVAATVSASVPLGTNLVNMVGVAWDNETYGPDGAASATQVVAPQPPPPPRPSDPGSGIGAGAGGTGARVVVADYRTGVQLAGLLPATGNGALLPFLLAGLALILLGSVSTRLARR